MNNNDFEQHLTGACRQMGLIDLQDKTFLICPITEEGRKYTSADDIMRLCFLPKKRTCTFLQTVRLFTWKEGYYPLWIHITSRDDIVILKTSLRLRKAGPDSVAVNPIYPFIIKM